MFLWPPEEDTSSERNVAQGLLARAVAVASGVCKSGVTGSEPVGGFPLFKDTPEERQKCFGRHRMGGQNQKQSLGASCPPEAEALTLGDALRALKATGLLRANRAT